MRKPITNETIIEYLVYAVFALITILVFTNLYNEFNRTGSGNPDELMKRGYFMSPDSDAPAAEETAQGTTSSNEAQAEGLPGGEETPEGDEQPQGGSADAE